MSGDRVSGWRVHGVDWCVVVWVVVGWVVGEFMGGEYMHPPHPGVLGMMGGGVVGLNQRPTFRPVTRVSH